MAQLVKIQTLGECSNALLETLLVNSQSIHLQLQGQVIAFADLQLHCRIFANTHQQWEQLKDLRSPAHSFQILTRKPTEQTLAGTP